jgi:oligopeptide/dipeptide ABC transporter ATP-binding protein
MNRTLLRVEGLRVTLGRDAAAADIVDGLSFSLNAGQTLGVVGESGCGKSMTALALMGLLPGSARATGTIMLDGIDLLALSAERRRRTRGRQLAMIFQEPMTALNPVVPVGTQIAEMLIVHEGATERAARRRAVGLLEQVGIAAAASRAQAYPHQLSGGMRQRVMIAMAIACRPALLIADEPTTALDVSVQAQILDLLLELQRDAGMAMLFISHNLGVVSAMADDIMVMYAGCAVEQGPAQTVLTAPLHPYTRGLIATIPDIARRVPVLPVIAGAVPDPRRRPPGCGFAPRCDIAIAACTEAVPPLRAIQPAHRAACLRA